MMRKHHKPQILKITSKIVTKEIETEIVKEFKINSYLENKK